MDHSSRKRVRLTSDMTPLAARFARTAIMTMPMIPPSRPKRTPHRTAVRRARTGHGKRNGAKWSLSQEGAGAGRPGGSPLGQL